MKRDDGGAAFPDNIDSTWPGMTLRDYFAGRSLHGLVQHWGNTTTPELARRAYELADAMLAERAKP